MSGEHYISKTVLEAIGGRVAVSGMPWQSPGSTKEIGINSLTAKILCVRHNSALAPLDTAAGQFFRALRQVNTHLNTKSLSRKIPIRLFSGEEIELWLLKTLCGLFHAKLAATEGAALANTHALDNRRVEMALRFGLWDRGCGMYLNGAVGTGFRADDGMRFRPLTSTDDRPRLCGGIFFVAGFEFDLIVDPTPINVSWLANTIIYRPSELVFERGQRRSAIFLSWPRDTPLRSVKFGLTNTPVPIGAVT